MGSIHQRDLARTAHLYEVDLSQEVGIVPKEQPATACRSGRLQDGTVGFLGEVPIHVSWDAKEELLSDGQSHRWWRYEAKANPVSTQHRVCAGHELVIAEHPYTNERVHTAAFKRASHKGVNERMSLRRRLPTPEALVATIDALNWDYWEKATALTAGFSRPEMSFRSGDDQRRYRKDALYVLGICEDINGVTEELLNTAEAKSLLRTTARRTIRFTPGFVATPLPLYDEVADQGPTLLHIAIRQALAGPHRDSAKWQGRPVMVLADRIYRAHLNSYNRRVHRRGSAGAIRRGKSF